MLRGGMGDRELELLAGRRNLHLADGAGREVAREESNAVQRGVLDGPVADTAGRDGDGAAAGVGIRQAHGL